MNTSLDPTLTSSTLASGDWADAAPPAGAVSWGAILAGAAGAASLSLILLILGTGLGLSAVSPWSNQGVSAATFGMSTVVWLTFTQLAASGMGGYLAGRLRTRWSATHTDEVYFRDTAHGFLAWAVASLVTAALLTSAIGGILNTGAQAGAAVAGTATAAAAAVPAVANQGGNAMSSQGYFVDTLFRKDATAATAATAATGATTPTPAMPDNTAHPTEEVGRIFAASAASGSLSAEDTKYLGQMISQRTGIPAADAEKRVTDTFARMQAKAKELEATARESADKARKTSSYAALWLFVSLLVGAFVASLAATYGGRRRDLV